MVESKKTMTLSTVPCLACRIRRKKCDRVLPCCGRCSRHGYLDDLCVYKDPVGLFLKNSSATVHKEKQFGEEMRREMRFNEYLLEYLKTNLLVGDPALKAVGCRSTGGYQGSISHRATLPTEQSSDALETVLSVLNKERIKQMKQKSVELSLQTVAVQRFDEMCLASFVGVSPGNTDQYITSLLQEITAFLLDESTLKKIYQTTRQVNQRRFVMGPPRFPESLLTSMESLIHFQNGIPLINLSFPEDNDKLPLLILLLLSISKAYILLSGAFADLGSVYPAFRYLRYATALLKITDQFHSLPILLAMVKLQLETQYSSSSNIYFSQSQLQQRSMTTKGLISRAKSLHWNQDLRAFYPSLSKDERRMYNDTWILLVFMDLLDTLELGHQPSIQLCDFRACADSEMETLPSLRVCHEVLTAVSFLDGEVSAEVMIEVLLDSVQKIKRAFDLISTTFKADHVKAMDLDCWKHPENPSLISDYYSLLERRLMRLFMFSILQALYSMASRCFEEIEQTEETIAKARVIDILAHKYSFVALSFQVINCKSACSKGVDISNQYSFVYVQSMTHDTIAFETSASGRSLVWLLSKLQKLIGLTTEELSDQLLYQRDDEEMLENVISNISQRPELSQLPLTFDFDDFSSDDDQDKLNELEKLLDPRNMVFLCVFNIMKFHKYISSSKHMDFSMIKMTKTFMLGIRYSFVGVRMFFPDEVKEYHNMIRASVEPKENEINADPLANDAFVGTFRDLFENGFETSKEFDLGQFFGSNYDENLRETWSSGLIGGFEYPMN